SGGPLFNMEGEVIGVNTAILSPNGGSIGIGFSMASNVVTTVVDQLREFGETRRGWLGVKIQRVTPEIAESLELDNDRGAMVTDVPEGPAAAAGIRAGDVILRFDGRDIADDRDLVARVAQAPIGEAVDVTVMRDGEEVSLPVTLGRREVAEGTATENGTAPGTSEPQEALGLTLQLLTPEIAADLGVPADQQGLVISDVDPASDAAAKGLSAGDVITEAGRNPVASPDDLSAAIAQARDAGRRSILLRIWRGSEPRFVALSITG
ncbi:MAG: PDZ domain-containing protein, partial [Paracoccus sp. (in: a-proteobacteria)]|nr:PDZ domain-containing protein [Paracoccus sp. (in: a-proteobacteria)]